MFKIYIIIWRHPSDIMKNRIQLTIDPVTLTPAANSV